jgi:hypothetical protein
MKTLVKKVFSILSLSERSGGTSVGSRNWQYLLWMLMFQSWLKERYPPFPKNKSGKTLLDI